MKDDELEFTLNITMQPSQDISIDTIDEQSIQVDLGITDIELLL